MSDAVTRFAERFEHDAGTLPGSGVPAQDAVRRSALDAFTTLGFPQPRDEDWKYTRVAAIEKQDFSAAAPGTVSRSQVAPLLLPETLNAHQLVFVDGRFSADLSQRTALARGAVLSDLASVLDSQGNDAATLLAHGETHRHAFTALNTAFAASGVLLRLDEGVDLGAPLHLLFLASGEADTVAHPRILIECAPGARAIVIEHYVALGECAYFNNVVTRATLGGGAALEHYKLQREAPTAFHVSTLNVQQDETSRFVSHSISLGAALSRHDINIALNAPGASCVLNGLYVAHGRQHVDYHTRVDHIAPACTSAEDYRGVLAGRARGVFNGRVYVHRDAQKSDASQSNRNLLLSRDAEIDTKPQLEIHADDVKCSHGATVGQLDEKMVFYLRSRGIDEAAARALLTYGFARDVADRMSITALREVVAQALLERLPQGEELRSLLS
jgi:Fe-S cluster assembly protein SufD